MADTENKKNTALPEKAESKKPVKAAKKKDKPGFFQRVGNYFRSLKSEIKKIVWSPWDQVRKNTLGVVVVIVAVAIVVGVLDYAFSQAMISLGSLF